MWACCWNLDDPYQFFVGTKRSEIFLFDTRDSNTDEPKMRLEFPVVERRPIIGCAWVPACPRSPFPCAGLLVQTLGSLWFFELKGKYFQDKINSWNKRF